MHRRVEEALEFGISLVRPGAVAREIDQKLRQFIANVGYPVYPHHTGHGIGVIGHQSALPFIFGSRRSRSASPRRLIDRMHSDSTMAGQNTSQGRMAK